MNIINNDSNKMLEYRRTPPTKILDKSSFTDAKLIYFNMRDYFQKK